jgi:hypothetical protein
MFRKLRDKLASNGDSRQVAPAQSRRAQPRDSAEQEPPLRYAALKAGEIRVLTIEPGPRSAPIVISLEAIALSEQASYSALSYTWGDPTTKAIIHVRSNDAQTPSRLSSLQVTRICQKALLRLRSLSEARRFWIDAICINQADLSERSAQVAQMGVVYKHASHIYIYIVEEDTSASETSDPTGSEAAITFLVQRASGEIKHLAPLTPAVRKSFVNLIRRPWFKRVWMLQEVYNGWKRTRILLGAHDLDWNSLRSLAFSRRLRSDRFKDVDEDADWPLVCHILAFSDVPDPEHLVRLLISSRRCEATEPRDKIYALLPMLQAWDRRLLPADYTVGIEQLNVRVARYLARYGATFMLAADQLDTKRLQLRAKMLDPAIRRVVPDLLAKNRVLPSWVPDVRLASVSVPIWPPPYTGLNGAGLEYASGGNPPPDSSNGDSDRSIIPEIITSRISGIPNPNPEAFPALVLRVRGISVGRIVALDDEPAITMLEDLAVPAHYSIFRKRWLRMQLTRLPGLKPGQRIPVEHLEKVFESPIEEVMERQYIFDDIRDGVPTDDVKYENEAEEEGNKAGDVEGSEGGGDASHGKGKGVTGQSPLNTIFEGGQKTKPEPRQKRKKSRSFDTHPLQRSINSALRWAGWSGVREAMQAHNFQDRGINLMDLYLVMGSEAPHDRGNFLEEIDQEQGNDVAKVISGRVIFVIEGDGRMGMAPLGSEVGDLVVILAGVPIPVVLRGVEVDGERRWLFVGSAYVNGLMQADAMDKVRAAKSKTEASRVPDDGMEIFELV